MLHFIGTYQCKADEKGRIMLPVSLKKQLSDNKLPNIPSTSTLKIQEKFSWRNEYDIDSVFEKMFEELKK